LGLYLARARFWGAGAPKPSGQRKLQGVLTAGSRSHRQNALQQPSLPISVLVRQLEQSGVLQPGTFGLSSVYRLLVNQWLDRPRLTAEGSGPTKAFETELANALWMSDVMDGPTLRVGDRPVHTFLFAVLGCKRRAA